MYARKPIIGIVGGIGSGKSFIARLFAEMGCLVIDSDAQVRNAYQSEQVKNVLRRWWGEGVFNPDGSVNRSSIAKRVFANPAERQRLEGLVHPLVDEARRRAMSAAGDDPQVVAYVWDTPLLFETGLNDRCDAVVFIDTPLERRLERVRSQRGWDEAELARREKLQWPLDKKRRISDHAIANTADADYARGQVRDVLSRILARSTNRSGPK